MAVVSDGDTNQELANLKVKVKSDVDQRLAMTPRQTWVRILKPPAVSTADDKEVSYHPVIHVIYFIIDIFFMWAEHTISAMTCKLQAEVKICQCIK